MTAEKKKAKFITMGLVLLALVAAGIGYTVWFAYHSSQLADASLQSANKIASEAAPKVIPITTFEACKKASGSILLQSYPEQCVTKAGKTFTDIGSKKELIIKEWGVKVAYTSVDTFSSKVIAPGNIADIVSNNLAKQYGCTVFGAGILNRELGIARNGMDNSGETIAQSYAKSPTLFTKVGNYYYRFVHDQAACSKTITVTAQNQANDFVKALVPKLESAN